MSIERAEFDAMMRRRQLERSVPAGNLQHAAQAAVVMDNLMDDPTWRVYQQMVNARLDEMRRHLAAAQNALVLALNEEKRAEARMQAHTAIGWIGALEWALNLPGTIKERGEAAAEELAKRAEDDRTEAA